MGGKLTESVGYGAYCGPANHCDIGSKKYRVFLGMVHNVALLSVAWPASKSGKLVKAP
jgi:hypothetical protein